jgi:hypothetical protein
VASLFLATVTCNIGSLPVRGENDALYPTFPSMSSVFITVVPVHGVSLALKTHKLKFPPAGQPVESLPSSSATCWRDSFRGASGV